MTAIEDDHPDAGPVYNVDGQTLQKFRRKSRDGLATLPADERKAYGAAVEAAVLSKQRSLLSRVTAAPTASCASGTYHSDGASIEKAIRAQHRAALLACPGQQRRARTPQQWQEMYDEAMKEKRACSNCK